MYFYIGNLIPVDRLYKRQMVWMKDFPFKTGIVKEAYPKQFTWILITTYWIIRKYKSMISLANCIPVPCVPVSRLPSLWKPLLWHKNMNPFIRKLFWRWIVKRHLQCLSKFMFDVDLIDYRTPKLMGAQGIDVDLDCFNVDYKRKALRWPWLYENESQNTFWRREWRRSLIGNDGDTPQWYGVKQSVRSQKGIRKRDESYPYKASCRSNDILNLIDAMVQTP